MWGRNGAGPSHGRSRSRAGTGTTRVDPPGAEAGDPDIDVAEATDAAVAHEGAGETEDAGGALLGAELEDAFVAVDFFAQGPIFGEVEAHGFFEVDVFAGADGGQGGEDMPVIGRGDEDGVEVFAGEQLAEVVVRWRSPVLVVPVDAVAAPGGGGLGRRRRRR